MTDDLMTRLRAADPAPHDDPIRDEAIWRVLTQDAPAARTKRRRSRLVPALVASALIAVLLTFGLGRGGTEGSDFNAAANTYAALSHKQSVYHFFAVSRLKQPAEARHLGDGFTRRFAYPMGYGNASGKPSYEEYWIAGDGSKVRGIEYHGPNGPASGIVRSVKVTIPIHDPSYIRPPIETDPASGFRSAYKAHLLRSAGKTDLGGVPAWRFTAQHGRHGLWEEWIVDRGQWLPLRYRYIDHNRFGALRVTNTLTVRFLKFEALPLDASTKQLLSPGSNTEARPAPAQSQAGG